jgi:hypothetical protein
MLTLIRGPITAIYLTKTSTPLTNLPAQTPQSAYSNGQKKKNKKKQNKKKNPKWSSELHSIQNAPYHNLLKILHHASYQTGKP